MEDLYIPADKKSEKLKEDKQDVIFIQNEKVASEKNEKVASEKDNKPGFEKQPVVQIPLNGNKRNDTNISK